MKKKARVIKKHLLSIVREMAAVPWLYAKNPKTDFSRNRKLGFENLLLLLLGMGGKSLQMELLEGAGYDPATPTASAFVQQREKLLPNALEYILHEFTRQTAETKRFHGYRLLAVDGSDMHTPVNPLEPDNFFRNQPNGRGYNLMHLNAIYDLCNNVYTDALIQNQRDVNEHKALTTMVDRSAIHGKTILIADRGFESYNNLAHIERKGWYYLIRIKDVSSNGILSGLKTPISPEFDITFRRILTRKQTKETKADPALFRFLPTNSNFDFLDLNEHPFYPISFRCVRLKLSHDCYETLITNLDNTVFPPDLLKELYHLRWGIETAFRSLKHSVGMLHFHSKKAVCISQEVFAALIMYNFTQIIAALITLPQNFTRYVYHINFALAIHVCRFFFRSRDPAHPPDVEALLLAHTLPVRRDRCFARNIRFRQAVCFNYRLS